MDKIELLRAIRTWCAENGQDDSLRAAMTTVRMLEEIGLITWDGGIVRPHENLIGVGNKVADIPDKQ